MADEKDRFGEKIHQSEKALEDQWARQQDAELLEKIRQKGATAHALPEVQQCAGRIRLWMAFICSLVHNMMVHGWMRRLWRICLRNKTLRRVTALNF